MALMSRSIPSSLRMLGCSLQAGCSRTLSLPTLNCLCCQSLKSPRTQLRAEALGCWAVLYITTALRCCSLAISITDLFASKGILMLC